MARGRGLMEAGIGWFFLLSNCLAALVHYSCCGRFEGLGEAAGLAGAALSTKCVMFLSMIWRTDVVRRNMNNNIQDTNFTIEILT